MHRARPVVSLLLNLLAVCAGCGSAGVINSDFLERAQFRGEEGDAAKKNMEVMLASPRSGFVQKPEEIAGAVICAVQLKKNEIVVGAFFKAAVAGYRLTGANPFAVAPPQ